jgi:hypothetical protein
MEIFKTLSEINVNTHTEKKGKFTYLSWAFAWAELKKNYPSATSKVYHDKNTNMPYFESNAGVIVKVGVTIDGLEHINYLPAMDFRNLAIPSEKITMMDVNKTIQRCTVKAIALHGLGLYIYAGEDLPEEVTNDLAPKPILKVKPPLTDERFANALKAIKEGKAKVESLDKFELTSNQLNQLK